MAATFFAALASLGPVAAGGRMSGQNGAEPDVQSSAPTVESVSRDAQREINACPDDQAFSCVAMVLTRYAEALRTVSPATRSIGAPLHKHCRSVDDRRCASD